MKKSELRELVDSNAERLWKHCGASVPEDWEDYIPRFMERIKRLKIPRYLGNDLVDQICENELWCFIREIIAYGEPRDVNDPKKLAEQAKTQRKYKRK